MRNFTRRLPGWSVLYHVLLLAAIGLTVLSAVSCRTQKSVEQVTIRGDTLSSVSTAYETVETVTQAVPGDSVSLRVPMEVMQNLPDGAEFSKKQGRTRVALKRQGEAVVAEATTDSVPREITRHEHYARDTLQQRVKTTQHSVSVKEKPPNACPLMLFIGAVVAVLLGLLMISISKPYK